MIAKTVAERVAAKKACFESLDKAVKNLEATETLLKKWKKLFDEPEDKLKYISYMRSMMMLGYEDNPVDFSQVWNWMVKADAKSCKAYHAATIAALKKSIIEQRAEVKRLSKEAC